MWTLRKCVRLHCIPPPYRHPPPTRQHVKLVVLCLETTSKKRPTERESLPFPLHRRCCRCLRGQYGESFSATWLMVLWLWVFFVMQGLKGVPCVLQTCPGAGGGSEQEQRDRRAEQPRQRWFTMASTGRMVARLGASARRPVVLASTGARRSASNLKPVNQVGCLFCVASDPCRVSYSPRWCSCVLLFVLACGSHGKRSGGM